MKRFLVGLMVATTATIGFGSVSAFAAPAQNVSFFAHGSGNAHWAPNQSAIMLSETTAPGAYAGAQLMNIGAIAPEAAPNFTQLDTVNENGGGSPRFVIAFADGGTIVGYRLQMSTLTQSDGLHWDSMGGDAGFLYNTTYALAVADHSGSVMAAYLVTDSGWEGLAYTNTITNVTYGENTYAS
jgi:hypothetical protein